MLCLLLSLASGFSAQSTTAGTLDQPRPWGNTEGKVVLQSASFSHYLPETQEAVLRITGKSERPEIRVKVQKLSKGDLAFLAGYMTEAKTIIKQTQSDSSKITKLFDDYENRANLMQATEGMIKSGTDSIGLHFIYGVHGIRYGTGRDVNKAERSLKIVIDRCVLVRRFFPNSFTFTLTSAYNALAVAKGRTGLVASAAANLKMAASLHSGSIPMVLTHNARRLTSIAKPGSSTHAELMDVASRGSNGASAPAPKNVLLISSACDDFGSIGESVTPAHDKTFSDFSCLACAAEGSFSCPANCKVGKRIEKVRVQVAFDPVRNTPIMGTKNIEHLCSNKSCLKGRVPCKVCKGASTGDDAWLWNIATSKGGISAGQVTVVFSGEAMSSSGTIGVVFDPVIDLHEAMILKAFNIRLLKNYYEISDAGSQGGSEEHTVTVTNARTGSSRELTVKK
jgi:hypothetical protein